MICIPIRAKNDELHEILKRLVFSTFFNNKRSITATVKQHQEYGSVTMMVWGIGGYYRITNTPEKILSPPDLCLTFNEGENLNIKNVVDKVCDCLDYHPMVSCYDE